MNARSTSPSASYSDDSSHATETVSATKKRPRVRSSVGCGNCKKRKVKCDEKKPGCLRCVNRRLKCPGYPTSTLRWSAKHEVLRTAASPVTHASSADRGITILEYSHKQPEQPLTTADELPRVHDDNDYGEGDHESSEEHSTVLNSGGDKDAVVPEEAQESLDQHDEIEVSRIDEDSGYRSWLEYCNGLNEYVTAGSSSPQCDPHTPSMWSTGYHDNSALAILPSYPDSNRPELSLPSTLLHVPTVLVEYYFQYVCRECSTFDSSRNPFRTMVSQMRNNSPALNYAIQSLAACKLANELPRMKVIGIENQGLALESLKYDCMAVSDLHRVSDAVLCTIFLLGMTTSWHIRNDIGLEYLALARRVINAKLQAEDMLGNSNLEFYQNALKYWIMIVSIVSGSVEPDVAESQFGQSFSRPRPSVKIMPHPWTGISPEAQQLFGDVLRLIRKIRIVRTKARSTYSRAGLAEISDAIAMAELLEAQCWSISIPAVDELIDTEDVDTPPVHHVLTARAYLLAALLHLYMVFPDVLDAQISSHVPTKDSPMKQRPGLSSTNEATIHIVSPSSIWAARVPSDPHSMWLRDIGLCIVECLETVSVKSGTRVVHVPLLLSVASALTLSQEASLSSSSPEDEDSINAQVLRCRSFITNRLETMHALMRFHAIDNVLTVIKETWKRVDAGGGQDVLWMDVMYELRCETLFG